MTSLIDPPAAPETPYTNVHGRRPGRGIRPWLLLPKVVAVALYIGGLAAVTITWMGGHDATLGVDDPRSVWLLALLGRLMIFFVVPALLVAMLFGVLLLLQHPRQFVRLRWLRIKLVMLLILIPAGHFWCRAQTLVLRDPAATVEARRAAARGLTVGLSVTLAMSLGVVVLGRLKPRLGQNLARAWADAHRSHTLRMNHEATTKKS